LDEVFAGWDEDAAAFVGAEGFAGWPFGIAVLFSRRGE
jgi:hypothetical protein